MTRAALICLTLIIAASGGLTDDFVIIRAETSGATGLAQVPLIASTDADGLREAMGIEELPTGALYAEEQPSGRAVAAQLDLIDDSAQFAALLPAEPSGRREIRVWLRNAPAAPLAPVQRVEIEREGGAIVARGAGYLVRHDPAVTAALPSEITFTESGKVFTPALNDRLHSREIGGFLLRNDRRPLVEVVAEGPHMAEVRIDARYLAGDRTPAPSAPEATYRFRYWAGLPLIAALADVRQQSRFDWNELHFLELHFQDESFTHFALDDPATLHEFEDEQQTRRSSRWGALVEGPNVLGMTGNTIIHDGLGRYGRYLHGPWEAWADTEASLARWLLISAAADGLQTLDTVAGETIGAANAVVLTEGLAATLAEIGTATLRLLARSDLRPSVPRAISWRVGLLTSEIAQGRPLAESLELARELHGLIAEDPGQAARWTPPVADGRLLLADDGSLGVGLRSTATGIELVSLFDMVTAREMLAAPSELFRLVLTDEEDAPVTLGSTEGWSTWQARTSSEAGAASVEVSFERPLARGLSELTATVTCEISEGESRWTLSLDNGTRWSIDQVNMPDLRAVRIGDSGLDDTLYLPQGYGRAFPGGIGARYTGYYPAGSCALPLMVVTDETSGLYVCAHDESASARMIVSETASGGGVPLRIETPAPDASVAGNDYETSGAIVIARVDGGWYPATQKYRAWLQENALWWPEGDPDYGRPDRPEWLDDIAAWVLTGGDPEPVVERTRRFAEFMDLPTALHYYNWHQIPFDVHYPHYFPTREGVTEGVAELQQAGVRVVPYINGRLWDTDTDSFRDRAHRYATRDREGELYIEVYGSGAELAPMCISQDFWHDTLHEIVMRLMAEVNVDGVYMDQIAAARPRLCYVAEHGHPLAGGGWWVEGYRRLLERIQRDIGEVSPEKMLTTESNAEPYARWFDTYLMCNSLGDGLVPLFPAVYGSKILGFGRYMAREDWDAPESLAQKQGQLFIWGTQLWWSNPSVIDHDFAGSWLRDLVHLRHRVREFFNEGRMLTPPVLEGNDTMVDADWHRRDLRATTPAVLASAWGVADGRILLPMINVSESGQTVTLVFDPRVYGLDENASFTVQRLGSETTAEPGTWSGATRHEIELDGVEPSAFVLIPR